MAKKKSSIRTGKLKVKGKVTPAFGGPDHVSKTDADRDSVRPKRGFAGATAARRREQVKIRAGKGGYEATTGKNVAKARSGKLPSMKKYKRKK